MTSVISCVLHNSASPCFWLFFDLKECSSSVPRIGGFARPHRESAVQVPRNIPDALLPLHGLFSWTQSLCFFASMGLQCSSGKHVGLHGLFMKLRSNSSGAIGSRKQSCTDVSDNGRDFTFRGRTVALNVVFFLASERVLCCFSFIPRLCRTDQEADTVSVLPLTLFCALCGCCCCICHFSLEEIGCLALCDSAIEERQTGDYLFLTWIRNLTWHREDSPLLFRCLRHLCQR